MIVSVEPIGRRPRPSVMRVKVAVACLATVLVSGCSASSSASSTVSPAASLKDAASPNVTASCPTPMQLAAGQSIDIDYVDTLRIGGRDYLISNAKPPATWDPSKAGAPSGSISCTLSTQTIDPNYRLRDGDATFLPVGTDVYLIQTAGGVTEALVSTGATWHVYLPLSKS